MDSAPKNMIICKFCKKKVYKRDNEMASRFKKRQFCSCKCSRNSREDTKLNDFGMIGYECNELKVLSVSHKDSNGDTWFKCICSCGKECSYRKHHLNQKMIVSCGHKRNQSEWETNFTVNNETSCWEWNGASLKSGYGFSKRVDKETGKKRNYTAHRLFYKKFKGEIPEGLLVCHHCDNRICCNPDHLFIGTHQDNCNDMMKKGRHVKAGTYKSPFCGKQAEEAKDDR